MTEFADDLADRGFRRDPEATDIADLNRFLRSYGLEKELNDLQNEDGELEVGDVLSRIPEEAAGGPANEYGANNAYEALRSYYEAIPPDVRADGGVWLSPDKILTRLLNETEYYHELADGLVRMCSGHECPHFEVCDFKEQVAGNRPEDGIECMEDRQVIQNAIDNFVDPPDGKPKVDPRQPAQELLFKQLVQLLVKQKRISMYMQMSPVLVEHWEILQDGEIEHFDAMNKQEHALVQTWQRTHKQIKTILGAMGISPRFEIQQDRFDQEEERLDAERRANEMYLQKVNDTLQALKEQDFDEGEKIAPEEAIERALESAQKQQEKLQEPQVDDPRTE